VDVPVDPTGSGVLDLVPSLEPGVEDVCVDAFGLVEIDDRLHQHVVVGVADRSDRGVSSARARASPKRIEMYR
jgi:hypothetical protein